MRRRPNRPIARDFSQRAERKQAESRWPRSTGLIMLFTILAAIAVGVSGRWDPYTGQAVVLTLAVPLILILGYRRSLHQFGRFDPFHPLVFPLVYMAFSFLAPAWSSLVFSHAVGQFEMDTAIAPQTPTLLLIGVLAYASGAALPWKAPRQHTVDPATASSLGRNLVAAGRIGLIAATAIAVRALTSGGVATRGLDQTVYSGSKALDVAGKLVLISAVVLLVMGRSVAQRRGLFSVVDVVLMLPACVALALTGSRNEVLAVAIVVLFVVARRYRRSIRYVLPGVGLLAAFMLIVLRYRDAAVGLRTTDTSWQLLLGDLAPAGFTTGATAAAVPGRVDFTYGSTLVEAVIRQVPSPIAIRLFGQPTDNATILFRQIIGFDDPNSGIGFSIPAEGYLNFGTVGLFSLCFALGVFLSWTYRHSDLASGRVPGVLYVITLASLPYTLRADTLSLIKSTLYPAVLVAVVLVLARSFIGRATWLRADGAEAVRRQLVARQLVPAEVVRGVADAEDADPPGSVAVTGVADDGGRRRR